MRRPTEAAPRSTPRGTWILYATVLVLGAAGVGGAVAWWNVPVAYEFTLELRASDGGPYSVEMGGQVVGETPFVLRTEDLRAWSDASLVPATWPPEGATYRSVVGGRSFGGSSVDDRFDPAVGREEEHVYYVREVHGDRESVLALRFRLTAPDGRSPRYTGSFENTAAATGDRVQDRNRTHRKILTFGFIGN